MVGGVGNEGERKSRANQRAAGILPAVLAFSSGGKPMCAREVCHPGGGNVRKRMELLAGCRQHAGRVATGSPWPGHIHLSLSSLVGAAWGVYLLAEHESPCHDRRLARAAAGEFRRARTGGEKRKRAPTGED